MEKTKTKAEQGARDYSQAHARLGSSLHPALGEGSAERYAVEMWSRPEDRAEWCRGWKMARDRHLMERVRYGGEAYVPVPLPALG